MTRPDVSKQCNPGTQHCNSSSVALSQDMWNSRRQSVPAPAQPLHRNRARSKAQLRRTSNDISTPHVGHDAPRFLLPSGAYAGARFSDSPSAHTLPPPPRHWVTDGSKGDGRIERGKVKGAWTAESDSAWHEDCFQQMTLVLKNILKVQA